MGLQVTFDLFSGRPNPVVVLDDSFESTLIPMLQPSTKLAGADAAQPLQSALGYRGLILEHTPTGKASTVAQRYLLVDGKVFSAGAAYRPVDSRVEALVVDAAARVTTAGLAPDVLALIRQELAARAGTAPGMPTKSAPAAAPSVICAHAPVYDPTWWNDGGQKQAHNNCYNYACDYRTDTFAQPGRANGNRITAFSCAGVRSPSLSDALMDFPQRQIQCPLEGSLVALAIWPRWDFHWYRMDRNGFWTHKPGPTAATNLDNAGHPITDPRTADRGRYTDLCGFMVVVNGHTKIS